MDPICRHEQPSDECTSCHHERIIRRLLAFSTTVTECADTLRALTQAEKPAGIPPRVWDAVLEASVATQRAAYQSRILYATAQSGRRHADVE